MLEATVLTGSSSHFLNSQDQLTPYSDFETCHDSHLPYLNFKLTRMHFRLHLPTAS